ncbi:MAG: D-2-hydroxyacid dehydrogenase [Planctomycetota bacterium]|nr:D-2-hydroxyacid dehydrogenase [Planctomycetota bacterium]
MPVIALVSKMSDVQREAVHAAYPGVEFLDFSQERDGLAARGRAAEIVYGNVRPAELPKLPNLKWIHAGWTGVENLLYPEMLERGVLITNTRGQVAPAMAEHVVAGLLYFARDFDAFRRAQAERRWRAGSQASLLEGSRALVLGVGAIGRVLIPKLAALGVRVRGVNTDGRAVDGCDEVRTLATVREALGDVDHLICLLPATKHTRKFIDEPFLHALKPGASVINVSRGGPLDEAALLKLLDAGHLKGALLDVTDPEPPPAESPLFAHPKVLLTGHESPHGSKGGPLGFETFLHNLGRYLAGDLDGMRSRVDPEMGY